MNIDTNSMYIPTEYTPTPISSTDISKRQRLIGCRQKILLAAFLASHACITLAHDAVPDTHSHNTSTLSQPPVNSTVNSSVQVKGPLAALPAGTSDLKFQDMFKMPVGAYGMEPSPKLLALHNKRVRIVGYMADQESFTPGLFILTPLPVHMGDEDDKFADDMPANSIFVHLDDATKSVNFIPGLINLTGVLSVGNSQEADGRISFVRLTLDSAVTSLLAPQQPSAHDHTAQQQASK